QSIVDIDITKAQALAVQYDIPNVYSSVDEAISNAPANCVYDVALPASAHLEVLALLPENAFVLMQKPMGDDLQQAEGLLKLCHQKSLTAAVNFQLRYAPFMLAAKDMIRKGWIGDLCDVEFNINVFTPWHLWEFLEKLPRVEIPYHSIHYLDFIRSILGNPRDVLAKTTKHPLSPRLASVRSDIIMDYGDTIRAGIHTNHSHNYGPKHQNSFVKFEGTKGAIKIQLGLLMDYPKGLPDKFEYILLKEGEESNWVEVPFTGSWFPHAFIGSMAQLMCYAEGSSPILDNGVEDVIWTMRCVEQAYCDRGGGKFLQYG
ncbi:MAG TPA: Gfo/Idh/MocA family oxidoreductase, partial [Cytophagaceae bacterium]